MWPKLLFDLLPHFARLMPIADKYLSSKSEGDKSQEAALAALAADVRGDLTGVTEAHSGLLRQLQEQSAQVAELGVEVTRARLGVESVEARVAKLEKAASAAMRLLWAVAGLLLVVFALLTILVVRVVR
jgi:membrane protein required for beta-lactamase induction